MSILCKILIVEDELMIRQGIRHLLDWESNGFEIVAETSNGLEALEKIEKLRPNIVITDIVMPVMNGIELIQEMNLRYPETQVIVLSGYSDFKYVKSTFRSGAIDYILKPMLNPSELLSTVRMAAKRVTGLVLNPKNGVSTLEYKLDQLLSGYCPEDAMEAVKSHFTKPYFILFGMDIPYALGPQADPDVLLSLVDDIAPECLGQFNYKRFIYNNNVLLFVINHDGNNHVEDSLAILASHMAKENPLVFFVCGDYFYELQNISVIYNNNFSEYLRKRFYHRNDNFVSVAHLKKNADKTTFKFSGLSKLLSVGDVSQAISLLRENVAQILRLRQMDETEIKSLAQNAVYQIVMTLDEMGAEIDKLDDLKRDCLARVSKPRFAEEFETAFTAVMNDLDEFFNEYLHIDDESVISKILAYINTNYYAPLTLTELASQFNFDYHYLSTYFGANNPEGFSKYLNRIRISKAEELLLDTRNSVSDICFRVGYTDHSYFTRVFKKYTGVTPSVYRSRNRLKKRT